MLAILFSISGAQAVECWEYLTILKSHDTTFQKGINPYETQMSQRYRSNIENLGLTYDIRAVNVVFDSPVKSYIPDAQRDFLGNLFELTAGGDQLKKLLYKQKTNRADLRAWADEYIPGAKLLFMDELSLMINDPNLDIGSIVRNHFKGTPLVQEDGFIESDFYFDLVSKGYIPIGNDHDISVHLLLYSMLQTRTTTIEVARIYTEVASPKMKLSLEAAWQVLQELRVFSDQAGSINLVGGYYSVFSDYIIRSKYNFLEGFETPFKYLKVMLNEASSGLKGDEKFIEFLASRGLSWRKLIQQIKSDEQRWYELIEDNFPKYRDIHGHRIAVDMVKKDLADFLANSPVYLNLLHEQTIHDFFTIYLEAMNQRLSLKTKIKSLFK